MRNSSAARNSFRLFIFCAVLCALAALPFLSSAAQPSTSVNIVNNSSREIRNVYLSHVNADDWGSDQLDEATIAPGQSFTVSNLACDGEQIKVIGEDSDGCFVSIAINCSSNSTWTITNDTARDCGY